MACQVYFYVQICMSEVVIQIQNTIWNTIVLVLSSLRDTLQICRRKPWPMFLPYLENLENLEFCHFLFQAWKCLEFAQKVVKIWNFNSKPGKTWNLQILFQASLYKMSFTKIILIYFFVISTLSTQTLIRSQIDLGFHCLFLEITWKIHRVFCYKRSGNPVPATFHFSLIELHFQNSSFVSFFHF